MLRVRRTPWLVITIRIGPCAWPADRLALDHRKRLRLTATRSLPGPDRILDVLLQEETWMSRGCNLQSLDSHRIDEFYCRMTQVRGPVVAEPCSATPALRPSA